MQFPTDGSGKVYQEIVNAWIRNKLQQLNWKTEKLYPNGRERADFYCQIDEKEIYVEVEFGHRNAIDHDYIKFLKASRKNSNSIFVWIVGDKTISNKMSKTVASSEYLLNMLTELDIDIPIIAISVNSSNSDDYLKIDDFDKTTNELKKCSPVIYFDNSAVKQNTIPCNIN